MASFAPGTSQQYMDDYYRRMPRSLGGQVPDDLHPYGLPQSPSRPAGWYSGGQSQASPRQLLPFPSGDRPQPLGQRPFQGTLQPAVPQQRAPDMSAYTPSRSAGMRWTGTEWQTPRPRPGRAQPMQPQSQGTPYGSAPQSPPAADPGGAFDMDGRFSPNTPVPGQPVWQQPSVIPGGGAGNLAYSPPDRRPPPFTTSIRGPDGNQYDPGRFFPMRDAFIQNINDARSSFAANPSAGMPQMDMGRMWGRAGDMVRQGWQNPLRGLFG